MSEKNTLRTRLVNKHDIEANWLKATNFTPLQGELIVYDIDENYNYERIKMGDGITNVNELPFISPQADWNQNDPNAPDYVKNRTHFCGRGLVPIIQANGGGKDYGFGLMEYRGVLPVGEFESFEEGVTYTISCNGISDTIVGTSSTILSAAASKLPNISANTNITLFAVNAYGGTRDYHIRVEGGNSDDVWTIAKESDVIVPLDEKYIPDTIARKSDIPEIDPTLTIEGAAADAKATGDAIGAVSELVGDVAVATQITEAIASIPQADWNQNDETQKDFIKNKPEGLASEEYVNTSIEKTGFIEKDNYSEIIIADNVNLKEVSNGGYARKYADWPSGVPLQEGARVLVKITPEGRLTGSPGVFVANDPAEIVAIVESGGTSGSWRLCLEQPYNLVYQEGSDLPFRTITAILYMHYGDGNYAFVVSPRDYEIGGANRLQGTMTYSLSLVFGTSGAAFENITMWSNTEGSTKRFELSIDDDTNVALTDISTGETKLLGGVQSDWNDTDETSLAFIKNKPAVPTDADVWETLINIGLYERLADENGNVLTDEANAILLI